MKTDSSGKDGGEVEVNWRIEPCGWDKEGNEYWLFDGESANALIVTSRRASFRKVAR